LKLSREIKTAMLVIVSILLFIWGYSFLKGKDLFSSYKNFYTIYNNVEGLSASANVALNGFSVGKITDIKILNNGKILVKVQVNSDFPISKSSVLQIYESGFISGKQIAVIPNFEDNNLAQDGDTLRGDIKLGMFAQIGDQLTPLKSKIENTLEGTDTLIGNFNALLDDKNKKNLSIIIAELAQTMQTINKTTQKLDEILSTNKNNIDIILNNLNATAGNFAEISNSVSQADLGKIIQNLEQTSQSVNKIMAEIDSGNGTIGKLIKEDAMHENLLKMSKELELLLQDLRLNPTRYINVSVFGKKNKPYVAPEQQQNSQ